MINKRDVYNNSIGKKFNRLTIVEAIGIEKKATYSVFMVKCVCDCGKEKSMIASAVINGYRQSCGCVTIENNKKRAEEVKLPKTQRYLLRCFSSMKDRCYNPNLKQYKEYGERGIKICDEWLNSKFKFVDWALKNGYKEGLSIERLNVNGNYEPSNCTWATMEVQANNKRNNHNLTLNGVTKTIARWSKEIGIPESTIRNRIKRGWSIDRIITEPVQIQIKNKLTKNI